MNDNFKMYMFAAILAFGAIDGEIHPDRVRRFVTPYITPPHPNQWGAFYRSMRAAGIIDYFASEQSQHGPRKGGRHMVWELTPLGEFWAGSLV